MRALVVVIAAGLLAPPLSVPSAHADPDEGAAPEPGEPSRPGDAPTEERSDAERAEALYREGLVRHAERAYAEAAALFAQAHALGGRPEVLFAWAQASRLAGDCGTARALFERFIASGPPPQQVEAADLALRRCAELAGTAAPPAPDAAAKEPGSPAQAGAGRARDEAGAAQARHEARARRRAAAVRDPWARGLLAGGLVAGSAGLSLMLLSRSQAERAGAGPGATYERAEARLSEARARWRTGIALGVAGGLATLAGLGRMVWIWRTPEAAGLAMEVRF